VTGGGLRGLVSLDRLELTETGGLDLSDGVITGLHELLVRGLKLLKLGVEGLLSILDGLVTGGNLGVDFLVRKSHDSLKGGLGIGVTEVHVVGGAHRLELRSELLERSEVATTLVVLEGGGITVLDGGISRNTNGVAKLLGISSAVGVADKDGLVTLIFFHERVPSRLHTLAVSSPRGLELDKDGLAGSGSVVVISGRDPFDFLLTELSRLSQRNDA